MRVFTTFLLFCSVLVLVRGETALTETFSAADWQLKWQGVSGIVIDAPCTNVSDSMVVFAEPDSARYLETQPLDLSESRVIEFKIWMSQGECGPAVTADSTVVIEYSTDNETWIPIQTLKFDLFSSKIVSQRALLPTQAITNSTLIRWIQLPGSNGWWGLADVFIGTKETVVSESSNIFFDSFETTLNTQKWNLINSTITAAERARNLYSRAFDTTRCKDANLVLGGEVPVPCDTDLQCLCALTVDGIGMQYCKWNWYGDRCSKTEANGFYCDRNSDMCASGICKDSLCCNANCATCYFCDVTGHEGNCWTDRRSSSLCQASTGVCGNTGFCNLGGCEQIYGACRKPTCSAGQLTYSSYCSGGSSCPAPETIGCPGGYQCMTDVSCREQCVVQSECRTDTHYCSSNLFEGTHAITPIGECRVSTDLFSYRGAVANTPLGNKCSRFTDRWSEWWMFGNLQLYGGVCRPIFQTTPWCDVKKSPVNCDVGPASASCPQVYDMPISYSNTYVLSPLDAVSISGARPSTPPTVLQTYDDRRTEVCGHVLRMIRNTEYTYIVNVESNGAYYLHLYGFESTYGSVTLAYKVFQDGVEKISKYVTYDGGNRQRPVSGAFTVNAGEIRIVLSTPNSNVKLNTIYVTTTNSITKLTFESSGYVQHCGFPTTGRMMVPSPTHYDVPIFNYANLLKKKYDSKDRYWLQGYNSTFPVLQGTNYDLSSVKDSGVRVVYNMNFAANGIYYAHLEVAYNGIATTIGMCLGGSCQIYTCDCPIGQFGWCVASVPGISVNAGDKTLEIVQLAGIMSVRRILVTDNGLFNPRSPLSLGSMTSFSFKHWPFAPHHMYHNQASYPNSPAGTFSRSDILGLPTSGLPAAPFTAKFAAYFVPPMTGFYSFSIASNSGSSIKLAQTKDPSDAREIASVPDGGVPPASYTSYSSQKSEPIYLKIGKEYYFEVAYSTPDTSMHLGVLVYMPDYSTGMNIPPRAFNPLVSEHTCVPKKANGETCDPALAFQCLSGNCVDGVCCDSSCDSLCMSCNVPGKVGNCSFVQAGQSDTPNLCATDVPESCGYNGKCNGTGGCQFYQPNQNCMSQNCSGEVLTLQSTCTGSGSCNIVTQPCADDKKCFDPNCVQGCRTGSHCPSPSSEYCAGEILTPADWGNCVPKLGLGQPATNVLQCLSGRIADGVCCESNCTAACYQCDKEGSKGSCVPVDADTPDNTCNEVVESLCGVLNVCDIGGKCKRSVVSCQGQQCFGNTLYLQSFCDGTLSEVCPERVTKECPNYMRCDDVNLDCLPGPCGAADECYGDRYCLDGLCYDQKENGTLCNAANECLYGQCVDGVCCDSACTEQCKACNVPGKEGTCDFVPSGEIDTYPSGFCPATGDGVCGNDGTCDGSGECKQKGSETICTHQVCSGNLVYSDVACNGYNDTCAEPTTEYCGECLDLTMCKTECFVEYNDTLCTTEGFWCDFSGPIHYCQPKLTVGSVCAHDAQCPGGFCRDDYCCNTNCAAACRACNLLTKEGTCSVRSEGYDAFTNDGECSPVTDVTKCGNTGKCTATGGCSLWVGHCREPFCFGNTFSLGADCAVGTCSPYTNYTCGGGLKCSDNNMYCADSCEVHDDCVSGRYCTSGNVAGTPTLGGILYERFESIGTSPLIKSLVTNAIYPSSPTATANATSFEAPVVGKNAYGVKMSGYIQPTSSGNYKFYLEGPSAGDVELWISIDTDTAHVALISYITTDKVTYRGQLFEDGTVALVGGNSYYVMARMKHTSGTERLRVLYESLDAVPVVVTKQVVPGDVLSTFAKFKCVPLIANGQTCTDGYQCSSGKCHQGVCCNSTCDSDCMSCALDGSKGLCKPIGLGEFALPGQCIEPTTNPCGWNGKCDGSGECQYQLTNVLCQTVECKDKVLKHTNYCLGNGTCPYSWQTCDGRYACVPEAAGTVCEKGCYNSTDCVQDGYGQYCDSEYYMLTPPYDPVRGKCYPRLSKGDVCSYDYECVSSKCRQGRCCATECNTACHSCAMASSPGDCVPVLDETPDILCTPATGDKADYVCGITGTCTAIGTCKNTNKLCEPAKCIGNTVNVLTTCDAGSVAETCPIVTSACPKSLMCADDGILCKDICLVGTDCIQTPPHYCEATECKPKKTNGGLCVIGEECLSDFCVDNVCCDNACNGTCEACDIWGSIGKCTLRQEGAAAETTPKAECPVQKPCGNNGKCDGNGKCQKWPSTTVCSQRACTETGFFRELFCNGDQCQEPPVQPFDYARPCTKSTTGKVLCIDGMGGSRVIETVDLDLADGGIISFSLLRDDPLVVGPGEDLQLQYSTDSGHTWVHIAHYYASDFSSSFKYVEEIVPLEACKKEVRFRFQQLYPVVEMGRKWAVDEFNIKSFPGPSAGLAGTCLKMQVSTPNGFTYSSVLTSSPLTEPYTAISFETWIKLESISSYVARAVSPMTSTVDWYLRLGAAERELPGRTIQVMVNTPAGPVFAYGARSGAAGRLPMRTWTHIAFSYNAGDGKIDMFVDGVGQEVLYGSEINPSLPLADKMVSGNATHIVLGVLKGETLDGVTGYIDESRLWRMALTERLVAQRMKQHSSEALSGTTKTTVLPQVALKGSSAGLKSVLAERTGLLFYYTYDEQDGKLVKDRSSAGNDGTLSDMNLRIASAAPLRHTITALKVDSDLIVPLKATPVIADGQDAKFVCTVTTPPTSADIELYKGVISGSSVNKGARITKPNTLVESNVVVVVVKKTTHDSLSYKCGGTNEMTVNIDGTFEVKEGAEEEGGGGNSLVVVLGAVGGSVVGLCACAGFIVLFMYKKQQRLKKIPEVPPPELTADAAFPEHYWAMEYEGDFVGKLHLLEECLVHPMVSLGLAKAIQVTEADEVTKCLVFALEHKRLNVGHIKAFISDEIRTSPRPQTLFRGNSIASKIMKSYAMMAGAKYLHATLSRAVNEYVFLSDHKGGDDIEVDESKNRDNKDADTSVNKYALMQIAQRVLNTILKAGNDMPLELRELCRHIRTEVEKKGWDEHVDKSVGGFLFLRYFAPALVAPHAFGLTSAPPSPKSQRMLTLVAKLLQNAANDVEFGKKEEYMMKMNDFIHSNRDKVMLYFKEMGAEGGSAVSAAPEGVDLLPPGVKEMALITLHRHMHQVQVKMLKLLKADEAKVDGATFTDNDEKKVRECLKALGPPPPAPKRAKGEEKGDAGAVGRKSTKAASSLYRKSTRAIAKAEKVAGKQAKKGDFETGTELELNEMKPATTAAPEDWSLDSESVN